MRTSIIFLQRMRIYRPFPSNHVQPSYLALLLGSIPSPPLNQVSSPFQPPLGLGLLALLLHFHRNWLVLLHSPVHASLMPYIMYAVLYMYITRAILLSCNIAFCAGSASSHQSTITAGDSKSPGPSYCPTSCERWTCLTAS